MGAISSLFGYVLNALYTVFNNYGISYNCFFSNFKNYINTYNYKATKINEEISRSTRKDEGNTR